MSSELILIISTYGKLLLKKINFFTLENAEGIN